MGNIISKKICIIVTGLDCSGKTLFLNNLQWGEVQMTIPEIGYGIEILDYKKIKFISWDVGGSYKINPYWNRYYIDATHLIFIIDSYDTERMDIVKEELYLILNREDMKNKPVLFFANKQDFDSALSIEEITSKLELNNIKHHKWHIQSCIIKSGTGVKEGLQWLSKAIEDNIIDF